MCLAVVCVEASFFQMRSHIYELISSHKMLMYIIKSKLLKASKHSKTESMLTGSHQRIGHQHMTVNIAGVPLHHATVVISWTTH